MERETGVMVGGKGEGGGERAGFCDGGGVRPRQGDSCCRRALFRSMVGAGWQLAVGTADFNLVQHAIRVQQRTH